MQSFEGIAQAGDAVRLWVLTNSGSVPPHLTEALLRHAGTGASPVDLVVTFAEAVYADATAFSSEARSIAAGGALLAETFGFHGMAVESRGSRIAMLLDGQDVDPAQVPTAKTEFVAPEAPAPSEE